MVAACSGGGGGGGSFAITSVNLPNGAVWKINRPIVIEFSTAIDFSTVNLNTINIRQVNGAPSAGEFYLLNERTVVFQPLCPILPDLSDAGLIPGGVDYKITVLGADSNAPITVKSKGGAGLALGDTRFFSTPVSMLPADLYFDTTVGPPVPIVRTNVPGDEQQNACYIEIGGDPNNRSYFERDLVTGAITLDPPLDVPLNELSDPGSQVALVLVLNQPVDPSAANIAPNRVAWQFRNQLGLWSTLSATIDLEANCTQTGATIRITPEGILPPDTDLRARISTEFRDIVGQTNLLVQDSFGTAVTELAPSPLADAYLESFNVDDNNDATAAFAEPPAQWGDGALGAAFSFEGTGGPGGDFDWRVPAGQIVNFDTSIANITGGPNFSNSVPLTVIGGVLDLHNMRVEAGATLRVQGTNTLTILASGNVEIYGTININGTDSPGVGTLNTTNIPEPGAPGQAGGGRGGTGSPLTTASTPRGGNGAGAFNVADAGGQGGETGWNNVGSSQINGRRGAGGGGGRFGADQPFPNATMMTGPLDQEFIGLDGEDGFANQDPNVNGAFSGAPGPFGGSLGPSPFIDSNPNNDFFGTMIDNNNNTVIFGELKTPWAGAGGGGGGDASFVGIGATFPKIPFGNKGDEKGAGGGGGGGSIQILALGDIIFGGDGQIRCRGGTGGGERTPSSSTASAAAPGAAPVAT